jgi:formylglycine-generating enzyme required for sulfatase activity
MSGLWGFFRRIAKAAVKVGLKGVLGLVPFGDVAWDVAAEICGGKESKADDKVRAEAQDAAQAAPDEVDKAAAAVADEVAASQSPEVREQVRAGITNLLRQVPAGVRTASRRADDPTGTTVPLDFVLSPEKVVQVLPARLPRFRAGDYPLANVDRQLVRLLGVGGFGEVWLACKASRKNAKPVAMKFCLDPAAQKQLLAHEKAINDLLTDEEAEDAANPGVVPLLETYLRADPPALEYKYVAGGDLSRYILEWQRLGPKERVENAARTVLELAQTTGAFHALSPAVVHRDLKPSNILVEAVGGVERTRIADFGIGGVAAQQALREAATRPSSFTGVLVSELRGAHTPLYASPEQKEGQPADPRDDVHALGVIWYQLLTGKLRSGPPTGRRWAEKLREDGMAAGLIDLLSACVEPSAEDRIKDGRELAAELAKAFEPRQAGGDQTPPVPATPARGQTVPEPAPPPPGPAKEITNSVGMKLVLIPAGRFRMGSPVGEYDRFHCEGPQHGVTITKPFYLGVTPVTQAQYERVMGNNPAKFHKGNGGGPDHPVESVRWGDAVTFLKQLSDITEEKIANRRYSLPTEAEWEYACRAGTETVYHFGSTPALLGDYAWFDGTSGGKTHPVGQKKPNFWGLFDMHGNVSDWCRDGRRGYRQVELADPVGAEDGARVVRGGCWNSAPGGCRAAFRDEFRPGLSSAFWGFRALCRLD